MTWQKCAPDVHSLHFTIDEKRDYWESERGRLAQSVHHLFVMIARFVLHCVSTISVNNTPAMIIKIVLSIRQDGERILRLFALIKIDYLLLTCLISSLLIKWFGSKSRMLLLYFKRVCESECECDWACIRRSIPILNNQFSSFHPLSPHSINCQRLLRILLRTLDMLLYVTV